MHHPKLKEYLTHYFIYSVYGTTLAAGGAFATREYAASLMGNLMLTRFAKKPA